MLKIAIFEIALLFDRLQTSLKNHGYQNPHTPARATLYTAFFLSVNGAACCSTGFAAVDSPANWLGHFARSYCPDALACSRQTNASTSPLLGNAEKVWLRGICRVAILVLDKPLPIKCDFGLWFGRSRVSHPLADTEIARYVLAVVTGVILPLVYLMALRAIDASKKNP